MNIKMQWKSVAMAAVLAVSVNAAGAVTIDATDRGWYDSFGFHDPNNLNFFTGFSISSPELRSFFVFDLSAVGGPVTGATLRLLMSREGYTSSDATETYDVHHVSTSSTVLVAGGFSKVATYTDLGDGTTYGTHVASSADNGTFVEITLNALALADINADLGGFFNVGGAISTLAGGHPEAIWANSNDDVLSNTQLILNTAPEPGTLALLGIAAFGAAALRRRRSA